MAIRSALVAPLTNTITHYWLYSSISTVVKYYWLYRVTGFIIISVLMLGLKNMADSSVSVLLVVWCFSLLLFPMS